MSDSAEIAKSFLSHNNHDKPAVEVIKGLLERGDRPIPCWFDKDDLRSTGTWMSQLEDAMATCGAAVVFYGPDGRGPFHKYEIDLLLKRAMSEKGRDALRLVLVLLPGAQESAIQGFISLHMWADFRKGLDDAAALQRLRAFILGEAPKSGPGDDPLVPKPEIAPYRGLEPFEGKHAIYFFGRDNEIRQLCGRLNEWPFTAVIGGSGSGKSSIVRAGLQTELAMQERPALTHTTTITVRPGANPIRSLAEQVMASLPDQSAAERLSLVEDLDEKFRRGSNELLNVLRSLYARDDQQILLVIDQFEELFTHSSDNRPAEPTLPGSATSDSQQTQFVELLATVAKSQLDRLRIVITLRADFFDRCLSVPTLKSMIENRTLLIGKLSDEALRKVIEAPAFKVGAYFEKGLVARILKDVENQNGSLPLLQHALKELWEQRRFGFLTDDAYDETGGVEGALKKRADATLQNLNEEQREIAKNIFLRLTTLGEGVSDTRRRVRKTELYPEKTDPRVIDAVLNAVSSQANRLIVTNDDGTVEVTHEALIQRWDTFKNWLAENRDDKRLHDRLRDAANEWADPQHGRDPSYLWEGGRLDLAETFDQTHPNMLTALEREFLGASIAKREYAKSQKEEQEREKLRHQEALAKAESERARLAEKNAAEARENAAKQNRLKRVGFIVAGVALVAAVIAGIATWSAMENEQAATKAKGKAIASEQQANRNLADANWTLAFTERDQFHDPYSAAWHFLRAAEASDKAQLSTHRKSAILALQAVSIPRVTFPHRDHSVVGTLFNKDESCLLTWSADGAVRLWNVENGLALRTWKHERVVRGAAFSRDESRVLTWSEDGTARLCDTGQDTPLRTWRHGAEVWGALFSRDESRLLTWSRDGTARLWDIERGTPVRTWKHNGVVMGAVFNRDESRVLTWSGVFGGTVVLLDVAQDAPLRTWKHSSSWVVHGACFSSDESRVLSWSQDGTSCLWDTAQDVALRTWKHGSSVEGAIFSRDESRVLTWGQDGTARLWDIAQDIALRTWKPGSRVLGAVFNRAESRVLTRSDDGTVCLWDTAQDVALRTWKHGSSVEGAIFSQDESRVLTWSQDGTARLWDTAQDTALRTWKNDKSGMGVRHAVFNRDESRVLTWSADDTARLWDASQDTAIRTWKHSGIRGAVLSQDESHVFTWGSDGTARMWDTKPDSALRTWKHGSSVEGAIFSRDESRVLTWGWDSSARLWDTKQDEAIRIWKHDYGVTGAMFSRDESRVLTWSHDNTARLWNTAQDMPLRTWEHDTSGHGGQQLNQLRATGQPTVETSGSSSKR